MFLSGSDEQLPWDALIYMTGHINYGGRVTDDFDRKCLLSILGKSYNQNLADNEAQALSPSGVYCVPKLGTVS